MLYSHPLFEEGLYRNYSATNTRYDKYLYGLSGDASDSELPPLDVRSGAAVFKLPNLLMVHNQFRANDLMKLSELTDEIIYVAE